MARETSAMVGKSIGKYRVLERLGSGGMGTVYKAVDETLDRPVAIKILHPGLADLDLVRRFRAEAVTLARLNHPGIATVYELTREGDQDILVMEYLSGETFEELLTRCGPQSLKSAVVLCLHVLDALKHAHRAGVIHRDLKPANLLLTESGRVKIMDFGIARVAGSVHMTMDGYMMGTPAYMAPEQIRGEEVDQRTDLYALGVVLYRLLTGQLPIVADTPIAMVQKQIGDLPTPVRRVRAELPVWVEEILGRALAKARNDRFQSAEEFSEALTRELARQRSEVAAALPPELVETVAPQVAPYQQLGDDRGLPKPSPAPITTPASGAAELSLPVRTRMPAEEYRLGAEGDHELDLELHHALSPVVAAPAAVVSPRRRRMKLLALGGAPVLLVLLLAGYRSQLIGPLDRAVSDAQLTPAKSAEPAVAPRTNQASVAEPAVVPSSAPTLPSPASTQSSGVSTGPLAKAAPAAPRVFETRGGPMSTAASEATAPGTTGPTGTPEGRALAVETASQLASGPSRQMTTKESAQVAQRRRAAASGDESPAQAAEPESGGAPSPPQRVPRAAARALLQLVFASEPYPVTLYADGQAVGRIDSTRDTVPVPAGPVRLRAVSEPMFLDHDFGMITPKPGEQQALTLPPLVSAFIGVAGERYAGLRIVLDGQPVPGPYPAQLSRIAAGPHRISFLWAEGSLQGVEVSDTIELTSSGHFAIRAVPENDVVVVQRLR